MGGLGFFWIVFLPIGALVALVVVSVSGLLRIKLRRPSPSRTRYDIALLLCWCCDAGMTLLDNALDRPRAERVVEAVEKFHARTGDYPDTLDELVPRELSSVPGPRPFTPLIGFMYIRPHPATAKRQALPPLLVWSRWGFYRITYDFEERRWRSLD